MATHGKQREARRAALLKRADTVSADRFQFNIASQYQIAKEYEKSFKKLVKLYEVFESTPNDQRTWRISDIVISLKNEILRLDAFLENRPEPSDKMKRMGKLIADFQMKVEAANNPPSKDSQLLEFVFDREAKLKYLQFQRQKLLSEQTPEQKRFEKLHKRQEELFRKIHKIPDAMAVPPRNLEEVEARVKEIQTFGFDTNEIPAPMFYRDNAKPMMNRSFSEPDKTQQRIIDETGIKRLKFPKVPKWDVVGYDGFGKEIILGTFDNEEIAIRIVNDNLNANPKGEWFIRYRGPEELRKSVIPETKVPKVHPMYTVYNGNNEVVKRFKSFIQAKALAYDNRDSGWRVSPDHEINRMGRPKNSN